MQIVNESSYDFIVNKDGEVMLVINAYNGEPENSRLLFDGKSVALFYRKSDMPIKLTDVPQNIVENLNSNKELLVCEMGDDGDFERAYSVPIVGFDKK
ncbi:MAG: hypothetical protein AB7U85_08340 [Alphaproteobacteria bacterium]